MSVTGEALRSGSLLAHFQILYKLGEGGMGEVYKALDTELDSPVALKVLRIAPAEHAEAWEQLLREARLARSINHPNIVTIYSVERTTGAEFIVMEFVEGTTLRDLLRDGPIEPARLLEVGIQLAGALGAAHDVGLLHRDIKPGNVIVTPQGIAKILDFGIAKRIARERAAALETATVTSTSSETIKGTLAYMSPEQARGEPLDARSDLFSLAAVLYECATGERPFPGATAPSVLHQILAAEPIPPSRIRPEVGEGLDAILGRAMAKERAARFASGRELARALQGLRDGHAPDTTTTLGVRAAPSDVPNNLPAQLTSFVGRERELAEIQRLLGSSALVTLTGAGGSGKTRLAIRAAEELRAACPDGIWFVDLAPLSDPDLVPQALADVLSVREQPGRKLEATLADFLDGKSLLLVLDNCEHLVRACAALVRGLLDACPRLHVLATSREALHLPGESVWPTPSLSVPPADTAEGAEEAGDYESVRLFRERALAIHSPFVVGGPNAAIVGQICWRLDGIPLAIELAAARSRALSPREILDRLEDRFRLLTGDGEEHVVRQQTLRATIDWSYDLLSREEQLVFQRVGVFAGSFLMEAAETIAAGEGIERADVLDIVVHLVEKSLLVPEEDPTGSGRFRLPETLRAYAREKLRAAGAETERRERHRDYFLSVVEAAEPELQGPDQVRWLQRLGGDLEDVRVALRLALEMRDAMTAVRFSAALRRFWWVRGLWSEGRARLRETVALCAEARTGAGVVTCACTGAEARATGAGAGARAGTGASAGPGGPVCELRIRLLHGSAMLARGQGAYDEAEALLNEGLAAARERGDDRGAASMLHELANIANEHGDLDAARTLYEESLALWRALGDKRGISAVVHNLGVVAQSQKDYRAAERLYRESLEIQRELGNRAWEAAGLNGLGSVALARADFAAARSWHEQALAIQKELDDRWGTAFSLRELGIVAERTGALSEAQSLHGRSLSILRDLGDREGIAESLEALVALAVAREDPERALRLAGAAWALRERIGSPLVPVDRKRLDAVVRQAKQALGPEQSKRSYAEGRMFSMEQAVRYGLEQLSDSR
ncbi:MAG: protein kinase domain-containing protein [Bacteroidota bacterium]